MSFKELSFYDELKEKVRKVVDNSVAEERSRIKEMMTKELLIKCECENGDCPNCLRLLPLIDSLIPN